MLYGAYMKENQTYKYFLTALNYWRKKTGRGCQEILAIEIDKSPGYVSKLLNPERKIPIPFPIQTAFATACGYSYQEFLELGEKILLENGENLSVTAKNGDLIGDVLADILFNPRNFNCNNYNEIVEKYPKLSEELQLILNSAKPPSWEFLQTLFCDLGINANYLLAGRASKKIGAEPPVWPSNYFDRVMLVFGIAQDQLPSQCNINIKDINKAKKNDFFRYYLEKHLQKNGVIPKWITEGTFPSHFTAEEVQKFQKQLKQETIQENNNSIKNFNDKKTGEEINKILVEIESEDAEILLDLKAELEFRLSFLKKKKKFKNDAERVKKNGTENI